MTTSTTQAHALLAWIPLLPLIGFAINGFWYALVQTRPGANKAGATVTGGIATAAIFGAFVLSVLCFFELKGLAPEQRVLEHVFFRWIAVGELSIDFALRLDVLSALFALVITGVGSLIHLYSIGYMSHDESPGKFFAYLNLFCFAMLMLVLGASLPLLFLGWEGVGLCSYLLIGYWYQDIDKARAGKKAFIANRVGDFGFLLGMFLIFTTFGTLDFAQLRDQVASVGAALPAATLTAIGLLLFLGCTGKSAQIPLFVWLPDAMAGPTPVSALIHAATMVTSGVYMLARLNPLFVLSPVAMQVIAVTGAITALFAATIAIVQRDIKKVLAYSTVSQLGYMFLACGVGAFSSGVFHVITHAFFKALLFLGAGSVIHGMHEEQDILKMGGLRTRMPKTFLVFAVGWLAICGLPPFSGFFSKDEILWHAYSFPGGSPWLYAVGLLTALLTAFYMTRLFALTFLGKPRFHEDAKHPVHESPTVMTLPLQILAVLSAIGGALSIPHLSWLAHWLDPVIPHAHELAPGVAPAMEWVLMGVAVVGAVASMAFALKFYATLDPAERAKRQFARVYRLLENKWWIDELYESALIRPILVASQALWRGFDVAVIDRVVLGFGRVSSWTGQTVRGLQTGSIQVYAFMVLLGGLLSLLTLVAQWR